MKFRTDEGEFDVEPFKRCVRAVLIYSRMWRYLCR